MKAKLFAAMALVAMLALPSFALAQHKGETIEIAVLPGYHLIDSNFNLENGFAATLGLGYNFDENWGVELLGTFTPNLDIDNSPGEVRNTMARLNALYHFDTGTNFTPYVTLGAGWGQFKERNLVRNGSYSSGLVNGGVGFKYYFNDVVALRMEAVDIYHFSDIGDPGDKMNNVLLSAGLSFQFDTNGGCKDEDHDGVCDPYDKCPGTPAGFRVDGDGCPLTVSIKMDVKFDFDKAVVKQQYMPEVAKVAEFMKVHNRSVTVVEGHTDSYGTNAYNQKLSQRRADAVRNVLVNNFGIDSSRLQSVGYGEERPVADNATDAGRAENRRVIGVVSGAELKNGGYDQDKR